MLGPRSAPPCFAFSYAGSLVGDDERGKIKTRPWIIKFLVIVNVAFIQRLARRPKGRDGVQIRAVAFFDRALQGSYMDEPGDMIAGV